MTELLIEPDTIFTALGDYVIIDSSWTYPAFNSTGIDMRAAFTRCHIPDSYFVDLESLRDPACIVDPRLKNVLTPPRPSLLRNMLAGQGIDIDTPLIVYDMDGSASTAPFLRYCLLAEGFTNVRLLKQGLPGWRDVAKLPVSSDGNDAHFLDAAEIQWSDSVQSSEAAAVNTDSVFMDYTSFCAINSGETMPHVIDARIGNNHAAKLPEDYGNVDAPSTHHISYAEIIQDRGFWQDFKEPSSLAALFNRNGITGDRPIVTHCYFGMAAANMMTALELAGFPRGQIYAGGVIDYGVKSGLVSAPSAG